MKRAAAAAGLIDVVEAAYRVEGDERTWLERVAEAVRPSIDCGLGVMAYTTDGSEPGSFRMSPPLLLGASGVWEREVPRLHASVPAAFARSLYGPGAPPFGLVSERIDPDAPEAKTLAEVFGKFGILDAVGMICCDPTGKGCCVTAPMPERHNASRSNRALFGRVAAHVSAGLRLVRTATREPEAILEPGGKLVHAEEPAKSTNAREVLRHAARAVDRARGRLRREDPAEALELWRGLVDGRWSLVDRFESDGRRYLVARKNDPEVRDPRALTERERQVAGYAALGHANKHIAYALGLAPSSVATHLASAMRKLGIRSRPELVATLAKLGAGE